MDQAGRERYERFVREFGGRAFRFALSLSGEEEEARELVQAAFCRILEEWDRYDETRPLEAWFTTVLRNLFIDGRRRFERRGVVSLDAPLRPDADEHGVRADRVAEPGPPILDVLERAESVGLLREALGRLNPEHRAVLTLCDAEDLSYEEVSRVLGVPVGTVRSRVSRARDMLRRAFAAGAEVNG